MRRRDGTTFEDCKTIRSGNPLLIVLLFLLKISPELSVGDLDRCRVYDVAYFGFRPVFDFVFVKFFFFGELGVVHSFIDDFVADYDVVFYLILLIRDVVGYPLYRIVGIRFDAQFQVFVLSAGGFRSGVGFV